MARLSRILDNAKLVNRLSFLFLVFSCILIVSSTAFYVINNWFQIEKITITGNTTHITSSQLSYIAKNKLQGTFFTLDINRLQQEFKQIPWVKSVTVMRDFPNSITVIIDEFKVLARLGEDALISTSGNVFSGADNNPNLPTFYTSKELVEDTLNVYNNLQPILNKRQWQLDKLDTSNPNLTKIYLKDGMTVVICGNDVITKFKTIDLYLERIKQVKPNLTYINMCYKNALAII